MPFSKFRTREADGRAPETGAREASASAVVTHARSERVVDSIAWVLAAVPSLGPARKAWQKLGFAASRPYEYAGCKAFDIELPGSGLRFLAPVTTGEASPLCELVKGRLINGAGLLGWIWASADALRSAAAIEKLSSTEFVAKTNGSAGDGPVIIPPALTPGIYSLLQSGPLPGAAEHPNRVTKLDQIVLTVSDTEAAAWAYEKNFALTAKPARVNDHYHAYLKVGESLLEVVGPPSPAPGPLSGHLWGLAFRTDDFDPTVEYLEKAGVQLETPHEARQGGRITGLPMQLGGIQIAFMGD